MWYTFTTNSVGGPVTVTVDNIDCPAVAGMDDELSVVVLSGDGSCTLASFSGASTCALGDDIISLTSLALAPSTEYWILVSGAMNGGATIPAQCGFTVDVTGPGAVVIGVDVSAGPDVVIGEGSSTQLQGIGNTFDWSPTSGLSGNGIPDPIAAPSGTTIYTLTSVIGGCTYTDEVIVEVVRLIEPPNTFTPNGDGINDRFLVLGTEIADFSLLIFNRWGEKIFESDDLREGWDGTYNGVLSPIDTYVWRVDYQEYSGDGGTLFGHVNLVR